MKMFLVSMVMGLNLLVTAKVSAQVVSAYSSKNEYKSVTTLEPVRGPKWKLEGVPNKPVGASSLPDTSPNRHETVITSPRGEYYSSRETTTYVTPVMTDRGPANLVTRTTSESVVKTTHPSNTPDPVGYDDPKGVKPRYVSGYVNVRPPLPLPSLKPGGRR